MEDLHSRLTLEQQFQVRLVELSSENLSIEELQTFLVELTQQLFVKENMIRDLVKEKFFAGMA